MKLIKTPEIYAPLYTNTSKLITLVTGGRASGKSYSVANFIKRLSFERGRKILFTRYTLKSANISIIPEFKEKIELEGLQQYFRITKDKIINTFSGSEIIFSGIKTSSGNQTAKLKSIQGLTDFICDEAEEWQSEKDYDQLLLSIRKEGLQLRVIVIMNPTSAEHFVYKKYIEQTHRLQVIDGVEVQMSTHADVLHIHSTYLDAQAFLSPQFMEQIEHLRALSFQAAGIAEGADVSQLTAEQRHALNKTPYATKIIGRWADVSEGVIFTNWETGAFDNSLPYGYGQDFGFSIDPDTLVKVAVDKKLKRVYIHECYYNNKQLSSEELYQVDSSLIDAPNALIVADSAEPRLIEDLRRKGLNIRACEKGAGSVSAGISRLLEYTLVVTPQSYNVMRELKNYAWNDRKAGVPQDNNNHAIDAIRYIFMQLTKQNYFKAVIRN